MNSGLIRVLLLTSRADFGGGPEHIFRLLNSLNGRIEFFIAGPDDYPYWDLFNKLLGNEHLIKIPHRKFSISALRQTGMFCRKNKISIVHSHGKGAGVYSRLISLLWGVQCVHTFHGIHVGEYSSFQKKIYIWLEKLFALLTKRFISVSNGELKTILEYGIAPAGKISLIENGTPVPDKTARFRFDAGFQPEITTITRFDFSKNTELLIPVAEELLRHISDFRFVIIGSGEGTEQFKKSVSDKNLEKYFRLTGPLLNTGDYLINSFCYISTSRWEAFGLGVAEAMSYALPVVATNIAGTTDLIENGINGLLYDLNKPEEAAACILRLLSDEAFYRRIADAARKKVTDNYSLTVMAEKTFNLYTDLKNN